MNPDPSFSAFARNAFGDQSIDVAYDHPSRTYFVRRASRAAASGFATVGPVGDHDSAADDIRARINDLASLDRN